MPLWVSLALSLSLGSAGTLAACFTGSPFASTCQPATTLSVGTFSDIRGCFRPDLDPPDGSTGVSVAWDAATGSCVRRPTACGDFADCPGRCLVSCEVATRGFLVLSLRAASGVKSLALINTPALSNGSVRGMPDDVAQLPNVFRASVIDQLPSVVPLLVFKEAVVSLLVANSVIVNVTFDLSQSPEGLSRTNWFSQTRLKASWPVTDLTTRSFNFFSVTGHSSSAIERRFFISYSYGGCNGDKALMAALDIDDDCPWGGSFTAAPRLIFSTQPSTPLVSSAQPADIMAIVIR